MKLFNFLQKAALAILLSLAYTPVMGRAEMARPEKVQGMARILVPNEWYIRQAELWKKEIEKNPKNAEAWYNYYRANHYINTIDKKPSKAEEEDRRNRLDKIVADAEKAIPNTYEYFLLKFHQYPGLLTSDKMSWLEKAYALRPDVPDIYDDFIVYHEIRGEKEKAKTFYEKLYQSQYIASGLVSYNYNMLMSVESDGILFTNGDNDTYPARMLQEAKEIRKDVTVLNVWLAEHYRSYLESALRERKITVDLEKLPGDGKFIPELCKALSASYPNIPVYFAVTISNAYTEPLKDNLYLAGLAFQYSAGRPDNLALIRRNVEKRFRLDYLTYDWYAEAHVSEKVVEQLNTNYIPSLIMLSEHYKTGGEDARADYWKDFALDIARKAGLKDLDFQLKRGRMYK